ncbi:MAG: prolyl oligopeptidase family serine peptidase [Akkermansiaceae bacterium]|nr:prolyl oligopeptidase family serine peptidase [Akkermansiaceae bacterium]
MAAVKVAVMGDSITFGTGAEDRENNRYTTRLAHLLGAQYELKTFAAGGLCMLREADKPFANNKPWKDALTFKPDIAIIVLGTNDTCQNEKRKNWDSHNNLRADSQFLVDELRKANPEVIVHLCSPPPMFPNQPGLSPDRKNDLIERSKRLATIHHAYSYTALRDKGVFFHDLSRALASNETIDGVHPNNPGHNRIAHHLYDLVIQPTGQRARFDKISRARSEWNGFERHDYRLPKTGAQCTLIIPHTAAKGQPWIWRARFFGHQPALDLALLDRGYHLAYVEVGGLYGAGEAMERCDEFYTFLTSNFDLHKKSMMEGMSRGGLLIFNYAAKHPDRVSAIYGDNPVCDFKSWPGGKNGKFSKGDWEGCLKRYGITEEQAAKHPQISDASFATKLAKHQIPVALVIGTADVVVPPAENGELFAKHYAAAGGPVKIWHKPGKGHHPHGLSPIDPLLRFLLRADGRTTKPESE